jgi:hypothetical protein
MSTQIFVKTVLVLFLKQYSSKQLFVPNPLTLSANRAFYKNSQSLPINFPPKFAHLPKMPHIFKSVNVACPRPGTPLNFE